MNKLTTMSVSDFKLPLNNPSCVGSDAKSGRVGLEVGSSSECQERTASRPAVKRYSDICTALPDLIGGVDLINKLGSQLTKLVNQ